MMKADADGEERTKLPYQLLQYARNQYLKLGKYT